MRYQKLRYQFLIIRLEKSFNLQYLALPGKSHGRRSLVGCSPWGRKEWDTTERLHFHFHFHTVKKEMGTHPSILAWRIPGTGEPDGLLSMGSHRVGHDWSDLAAAAAAIIITQKPSYAAAIVRRWVEVELAHTGLWEFMVHIHLFPTLFSMTVHW